MVRQERAEATRAQILDAAAEIFADGGYLKANLGEIVARADVTKGALYFHFDSKESLAREIIDERDRRVAKTRRAIEDSNSPPMESMIQQSIAILSLTYSNVYVRAGDRLLQEMGNLSIVSPSAFPAVQDRIRGLLEKAATRGDLCTDDFDVLSQVLLAQFWGVRMTARASGDRLDLITCLERMWLLTVDSIVVEEMRSYFRQVITRTADMHRSELTSAVGVK